MRYQADEARCCRSGINPRRALVALGCLIILAACTADSAQDPAPTSSPVLTTEASTFTTTSTSLPPGPVFYTIEVGDTLSGVAAEFGITLEQLLGANPNINDADLISPGDQILIPDIPRSDRTGLDGARTRPARSSRP